MNDKPIPKFSTLLPVDARESLIAASKLPGRIQRLTAVQDVTERIQRKYPQFFRQPKGATR